MGRIVDWQYMSGLSVSAALIDAQLASNNITGFSPVPYGVKVYRVRYVTQDKGKQVEATALLSFPDTKEAKTFPTVLWTHGTTGFTDKCAPSAQGLDGGIGNILLSSQGYAVAAPDYLGMNGMGEPAGFLHPYLVAEATAIASLDSLRALTRFQGVEGDTDLVPRSGPQTIFWGGSEGGFAAFWADRYLEGYGPELNLVATVAIVPPTDLKALAHKAVEQVRPATAALAAALAAINDWHGNPSPLSDVLTNDPPSSLATTLPQVMMTQCGDGNVFDGLTATNQVYTQNFIDAVTADNWASIAQWSCYLEHNTLNATTIARTHDAPVLFIVSGADDLVVADTQRKDFPVLCGMGYRMQYYECEGASHTEGATASLPYQMQWVKKRLAGEALSGAVCELTTAVQCTPLATTP